MVDTNTRGAFLVSRAAARALIAAKTGGSIINVASILGLRVAGRVAPYAAPKAALIQLTRALALEWARYNIPVNAIAPGYIETDLNEWRAGSYRARTPGRCHRDRNRKVEP